MATPSTPQAQQSGPSRIVTAVQTGLSYEIGDMSPTSQENAVEALSKNRMSMVRCFERDDDFHFELQERILVTVSDDEAPTCSTCPDDEDRACRHIWWINDQILKTTISSGDRSRYPFKMSRDGQKVGPARTQQRMPFYGWLQREGLHTIAQLGGWWKQDPLDQHDTRLVEQTTTQILSTFEPSGVLSSQHGQDNLQMLQQESQALFTRYRNEMIKQVKSQPFLLVALGAAVPEAERDLLHLTKIHSRIERIFFDYGYWMTTRTPDHSNLDATAEALHNETAYLHSFVREHQIKARALQEEMPEIFQIKIIGILLYTLEQLKRYSGDSQTSAVVPIPQYSGLSLQDRSLLHKLIDPRSQNVFVLPILDGLDEDIRCRETVQVMVRALANILRGGNEPCPEDYILKLEGLVGLNE
ncbi:hypothetical protein KCU85_g3528, partial [Aureobasidium melanogenum]